MEAAKEQELLRKKLHDLLWSHEHWLFVTEELEARARLEKLAQTPEVRQWGGPLEGCLVLGLAPEVPHLWVGGIRKALLPPHVMGKLLDRVNIAYTPRYLAGLAQILFVCREVPRGELLMRALADFVGGTRFQVIGEAAASQEGGES